MTDEFKEFLQQTQDAIKKLAQEELKDHSNQAAKDGKAFLNKTKKDLERWLELVQAGELSKADLKWLLQGKKDVAALHALKQAGLSLKRLEIFANSLVETIVNAAAAKVKQAQTKPRALAAPRAIELSDDFKDFLQETQEAIKKLAQEELKDHSDQAAKDGKAFLNKTKKDLERWLNLAKAGELSKADLTFLLKAKKDVAALHALKQAGISLKRLEIFANSLVETVVNAAAAKVKQSQSPRGLKAPKPAKGTAKRKRA